ncbi:TfoX/Sxy family protein [Bradyrhizobium sp. LHD-71]|uniref:TfoX/Sxy family protein n=1 Tax=Bradyrhizobium sp. LHD-71 TaxID=3072141 RepID=UPI00280FB842|nr:TfoX/Sxy family protein [Bradyrhizobium sp. LHD-71]MDQ8731554.1 TfoX/Sxy family protein [Bradyrhizobium sp. LHD-71]
MDRDAIAELFSAYGPIQLKRMFSGFGLYAEGVCFCLVLRGGELYFKADESNIPQFEAEGCKPFSYSQRHSGKTVTVNSFWRLPDRLYDDPDELADWTRAAVIVAHRAQLAKTKRGKSGAAKRKPIKAAKKPVKQRAASSR